MSTLACIFWCKSVQLSLGAHLGVGLPAAGYGRVQLEEYGYLPEWLYPCDQWGFPFSALLMTAFCSRFNKEVIKKCF